MSKYLSLKNKFVISITFLILLAFLGNIVSVFFHYDNYFTSLNFEQVDESRDELNNYLMPYLDTSCNYSQQQLSKIINYIEDQNGSSLKLIFYESPSSIYCHDRPVSSSFFGKELKNLSKENISVAVGVNTDIENIERMAKFLLLFLLVALCFSKFKISYQKNYIKNTSILIFLFINITYSIAVFNSTINALSNFLIFIFMGNFIFFFLSNYFSQKVILQSLVSILFIPFMFLDLNVSFIWITTLYTLNIAIKSNEKISKMIIFVTGLLTTTFIYNLKSFNFEKPNAFFDWILFTSHRHHGSIADLNNGLQSFALLMDIILMIFIIYILFRKSNNSGLKFDEFLDSIILGFLIWIIGYSLSTINHFFYFELYKFFGLSDQIDPILKVQADGINWRGITSSHELTGFWLYLISSLSLFKLITSRKYYYLIPFFLSILSMNWNSQRSALVLFIFVTLVLFIKRFKLKSVLVFVPFIFLIYLLSPDSVERLSNRIQTDAVTTDIEDKYKRELKNSISRYERLGSSTDLPDYRFEDLNNWYEFYELETGVSNRNILGVIIITEQLVNRGVQWGRYLYFEDIEGHNIFGKGPGQSHQTLVELIETPHSLYLTAFYQYGWIGIGILISLIIYTTFNLYRYKLKFYDLLLLTFFINGLKTEFLMTHNQVILFLLFFILRFFAFDEESIY